jgi:outer membrane protein OmpA-like peptidoglycan-associated protein
MERLRFILLLIALFASTACTKKQMCLTKKCIGKEGAITGKVSGAVLGAGSGAITGFQLGSGSGPGAAVGAGLGALAGGIRGVVHDRNVTNLEKGEEELEREKLRAQAQSAIADLMSYRLSSHPSREIYPADLFFAEDSSKLKPLGKALVSEIYLINKNRLPWSRLGVVSYVKSTNKKSSYSNHLAEKRALAIANELVRSGIEPRRVIASGVVGKDFLIKDANLSQGRYGQAIEIVPLDR